MLQKPGVDKIAVMMSIVSNTRVDIVARGVIKACLELGYDPAEKIAIFRIPGAWEDEGFKILEKYGVEYADRSVSMHEAARRAVEKIRRGRRPVMSILIDADTTFIVQGITGREAVNLTRECLDYGTGAKIVGGVTPGRKGRDVHGVPVFDTVAQAVEHHGAPIDGSVVTVPPAFTKDAVFEALENGIKLIVIVTERIPRRDVAQMVELATLRGARIIGPNCLGIIVPDVIKMGGIGGPAKDAAKAYSPGPIGVISRSGGMTTEMSSTLTAAGLGQSTAVSIGGDAIIGSSYAELMPLFEADEQTQGIVIYTEPGGRMEAELARWVTENDSRLPIVAFMAGRFMDEMPGMSFGHAGTIVEGKEDTATEKIARLAEAGITVAEEISEIPDLIKSKIAREERRHEEGRDLHRRRGRRRGRRRRGDRRQAHRGLPGRHLRPADGGSLELARGQPRRVRALRPVPGRRARQGPRAEALRRRRRADPGLARRHSAAERGARGGDVRQVLVAVVRQVGERVLDVERPAEQPQQAREVAERRVRARVAALARHGERADPERARRLADDLADAVEARHRDAHPPVGVELAGVDALCADDRLRPERLAARERRPPRARRRRRDRPSRRAAGR